MEKLAGLSVFFPAYNEEKNIEKTARQALEILPQIAQRYEVIIVDDGSSDKTGEIADNLSLENKSVSVIHHRPNRGYGASLRSGFYSSKYDWIAFTDSDGQFDFIEITNLIEKQKETNADMVIGYYFSRAVPLYRKLNTFFWLVLIRAIFGLRVREVDCGFKLLSKRIIDTIPQLESERGAFISTELIIKTQKSGFKIAEIGVHHYPDVSGGSTGASPQVILRSFLDLMKLWRKLRD